MVVLLLVAVGVFGLSVFLSSQGLDWADKFGSAASLVIAVIALLYPVLSQAVGMLMGGPAPEVISLAQARDELAATLSGQWAAEDRWRRTYDPRPLPVRWESADGSLDGVFGEIAQVFLRLPQPRLVILGPAGAGKTVLAVKLARDLLAVRTAAEPVPIILNAVTWDPEQAVTSWIESELIRNYPRLSRIANPATGDAAVARLLAQGGVLLIVDGLDELPESLRRGAIARLNAHGSDNPLVVTSRPDEYAAAVASIGRPLAQAQTVGLRPLLFAEVTAYLVEATTVDEARWQSVFTHIDANPSGRLVAVLTNPLMLWLVRTIYERPDTHPADLLAHVADEISVESYLLGHFLPAVYRQQPDRRTPWRAERAERWLRKQASRMYRDYGRTEIRWWSLARWEHAPSFIIARIAGNLPISGAAAYLLLRFADNYRHHPATVRATIGDAIGSGLIGSRAFTIPASVADQFGPTASMVGRWILGLLPPTGWAFVWWTVGIALSRHRTWYGEPVPIKLRPWRAFRRFVVLVVAVVALLTAPAVMGIPPDDSARLFVSLIIAVVIVITVGALRDDLTTPADLAAAPGPLASLRADRWAGLIAAFTYRVVVSCLVALILGWRAGVLVLAVTVLLIGARQVVGSYHPRSTAYERYAAARLMSWISRTGPWRMMAFLEDAHSRGVFRQTGAAFRFRHLRLQQHLADSTRPGIIKVIWSRGPQALVDGVVEKFLHNAEDAPRMRGLDVTRNGRDAWIYHDPRLNRWAEPTQERPYLYGTQYMFDVLVDGKTMVGRRPGWWRYLRSTAILVVAGKTKARGYLLRHAPPLDWPNTRPDGQLPEGSTYLEWPPTPPELPAFSLRPDEVIYCDIRMNPIAAARPMPLSVLAAVSLTCLVIQLVGDSSRLEYSSVAACVLAIAWAIVTIEVALRTRIVITNQRIISTSGFIVRNHTQWPLSAVAYVSCIRPLLGGVLNFGTIRMDAHASRFHTSYATSPFGRLLGSGRCRIGYSNGKDSALAVTDFARDPVNCYLSLIDLVESHRYTGVPLPPK
jgi:hypothetical protein